MKRTECSSDLVARGRQRSLTHDERVRLEAHLEGCAGCRLELQVGCDFDDVAALRPGDHVLDARLADAVMRGSGGRRSRRVVAVPLAAAAMLMAAAAMAGAGRWVRGTYRDAPHVSVGATAGETVGAVVGAAPAIPRAAVDMAIPQVASPQADGIATPVEELAARPVGRPATAAVHASAATTESAAALFQSANEERRHRNLTRAISLYDELERRFPRSDEARTSHVSLGRLLLDRGLWSDALPQLDGYLAAAANGTLAQEALFGKARALEALGRRDEAKGTWSRLLASYPDGVYASQARQRLDALR